jgi:NADPH:quinone reductase-like Zn-dependent oxidoreductase
MKAAVFYEQGPPEVLKYDDVADPLCGPDQIVIRVSAVSLEGGDTLNRGACHTYLHDKQLPPKWWLREAAYGH